MMRIESATGRLLLGLTLILTGLFASGAGAEATLEMIGQFSAMGLSADGTVATGLTYDGLYDAIRWTTETGPVNLGMSSGAVLGRGGGRAQISADGERVAYTIITADSLYVTPGLWTKGEGWQQCMPPALPDGGLMDDQYGSAWCLSGDGETVVGLYWRPGQPDGSAHAFTWTEAGGMVSLGSQGQSSRANGCNYDGSVVVGWSSDPTGAWQPTIWEDGVLTVLSATDRSCMAQAVSDDGNIIVGRDYVEASGHREAAVWVRDGAGWQVQHLGVLPGTFVGYGSAIGNDVTAAGDIIVGQNAYNTYSREGFVWTFDQGLMKAEDYFSSLGITMPEGFNIMSVTAITNDGRYIAGWGAYDDTPDIHDSFIVSNINTSSVPGAATGARMALGPNFPNPFNPSTTIALTMATTSHVRVELFDVRGRLVRTLHDGNLTAGSHDLLWDGRDDKAEQVGSGVYLARARHESGETSSVRMTMVK